MPFSRQATKKHAIEIKIRRAKCMAKSQQKEYKLHHAGECRDANTGNFTVLIKRITEETQKKQVRNETFQRKLHQDG